MHADILIWRAPTQAGQLKLAFKRGVATLDGRSTGEPAPVILRELATLAPKPGSEHTVLLSQVVDHILLLAVDPVLCQNSALLK